MKKMMITLLAVTMILSGCGKKDAISKETTVPPTTEEVIAETAQETSVPETEPTIVVTEPVVTEEATESPTEATTEPAGEPGVVVNAQKLNVREEPSLNAKKVTHLKSGTQVMIYETVENAGMTWGRIDLGWVCMDYIRLGDASVLQEKPAESQPVYDSGENNKHAVNEDKNASQNQQENETPQLDNSDHDSVQNDEDSHNNDPVISDAPDNNETIPAPTTDDNVIPSPTQHKHKWIPMQNISAEYEERGYVVCSCGARFKNAIEWASHRDTYLGSENIINHTGYSSGSEKIEIAPAQVVWQCSDCGISKTLGAWENP